MPMNLLTELPLSGQRVLIRQDLNVPLDDAGNITSDQRIQASLPTLQYALQSGARVMVMSHLGRPTEGEPDPKESLRPVAERLSSLLDQPVRLVEDYLDNVPSVNDGEVVLLENVRFNKGEKANDDDLGRRYAALCDVFAMDAFGTAHRAQASTHSVAKHAPIAAAGPLLSQELDALGQAFEQPERPLLAIVGGSKVSTKLTVLESLLQRVDQLVVGGGIANTFIAAAGHPVGQSMYEADMVDTARSLIRKAEAQGASIPIPTDVVCAKSFSADAEARVCAVDEVADDELILDIGPDSAQQFAGMLAKAGTIVWNGPVGVFEFEAFSEGTRALARAVAQSSGFSVAGGGDTLAAIDKFDVSKSISYISTGGGAFLEFLEGRDLPAVEMLKMRMESS